MKVQLFVTLRFSHERTSDSPPDLEMYKVIDLPFVPMKGMSLFFKDFWPKDYEEGVDRHFKPKINTVFWWNVKEEYWEVSAEEENMSLPPEDRARLQKRMNSMGWTLLSREPNELKLNG